MSEKEKFRNPDAILDVYEKPELGQGILLSLQHYVCHVRFYRFGSNLNSESTQVSPCFHQVSVL
mgnify:CR=1 FL=1